MNFLFDHDVPDDAAYGLVAMGHTVVRPREVLPADSSDETVFTFANSRELILITCNRDDFLELAGSRPFFGLIILVRRQRRAIERAALVQLIDRVGEDGLRGAIHFA